MCVPFGYFPANLLLARLKEGLLSAEGYFPAKLLLAKLGLGSFCSIRAQDFNPVFWFWHESRWVENHASGEGVGVGKEYFVMGTSPEALNYAKRRARGKRNFLSQALMTKPPEVLGDPPTPPHTLRKDPIFWYWTKIQMAPKFKFMAPKFKYIAPKLKQVAPKFKYMTPNSNEQQFLPWKPSRFVNSQPCQLVTHPHPHLC